MNQISFAVSVYESIRRKIIALEGAVDDETLSDTLEGLTNLHEVIAAVVRSALINEALAEGLKAHILMMQKRLQRLHERAFERRRVARDAMLQVQLKKITAPDFVISIRPGSPAVVVLDEEIIPAPYWQPRQPRLDKEKLLIDLKKGARIDGAELLKPEPIISVRAK